MHLGLGKLINRIFNTAQALLRQHLNHSLQYAFLIYNTLEKLFNSVKVEIGLVADIDWHRGS